MATNWAVWVVEPLGFGLIIKGSSFAHYILEVDVINFLLLGLNYSSNTVPLRNDINHILCEFN